MITWFEAGGGTLNSRHCVTPAVTWLVRAMIHALRTLAPHFAELRRAERRVQGPWAGPDAQPVRMRARGGRMRRLVLLATLAGVLMGTGRACTRHLYVGLLSRARADLMDVIFGEVSASCFIWLLISDFSFRVLERKLNKVFRLCDDGQVRWRHVLIMNNQDNPKQLCF